MTAHDGLERQLSAWLADVATPSVPEYTNDLVQHVVGHRQRPRWTFPERWLPMTGNALERVPSPPMPWRTIAMLASIALLIGALLVVSAGSTKRGPAPFGLAANGLVAYAADGDVWTVDPQTGTRSAIVTGPEQDHDPRWSPNGTRIAFLRDVGVAQQVVIVAADRDGPTVVTSQAIGEIDSDSFKWAPDGRSLVVSAPRAGSPQLWLIDAEDGRVSTLPVEYVELEPFWRPPDGRELLFVSGRSWSKGLSRYSLETGEVRDIPNVAASVDQLRPMGFTPDGRAVVLHRESPADGRMRTFVIDVETGETVDLDVGYGHISNGGDRVAGIREGRPEAFCVVDIRGGPCAPAGPVWAQPFGAHFESLQWSPDDRWVVVQPELGRAVLIDPTSGDVVAEPNWVSPGAEAWQRLAP